MNKLTINRNSKGCVSYRLSHNKNCEIQKIWLSRLNDDRLPQSQSEKENIVQWLLKDVDWNHLTLEQKVIAQQRCLNRYQILKQRYLNGSAIQVYRNLIYRLSSVVVLSHSQKSGMSGNPDAQRTLLNVIQRIIQEMLTEDDLVKEMLEIAQCTRDESLRDRLLLASIEEYCLRCVDHQPLLVHRFYDYLRCRVQQRNIVMLLEILSMTPDESQTQVMAVGMY